MGHNGIRTVADGFIAFSLPGYQLKEVRIDIMEKLVGRTPAFYETVFNASKLIVMFEYGALIIALKKHGEALLI
jgi:hypothetical protein